ncbi:MAG: transcriptional regulator [Candidatus Rokubacteria bacterium]|nr:transcriptional regulator [Candidatus Rokubacteria bacterium]
MTVDALLEEIRRAIAPVEAAIRDHRYVAAIEAGAVPRERLRPFVGEQYHIIGSDLRSVAHLLARSGEEPGRGFFLVTLQGEAQAFQLLLRLGEALGVREAELGAYEPLAGAHAYTAYMAWLALYGSEAEVAAAFLVNFPAWGANCGRLSRALQARYGLPREAVAFLDLFATPSPEFEAAARHVIEAGLARGVAPDRVRRAARLLQAYEQLFWDTMAEASGLP